MVRPLKHKYHNLASGLAYNSRIYKVVFHKDITYQHPLFVNNLNNNHYFTNKSTNNRSVSPMITRTVNMSNQ